jgi:hypothetical protein
MTQKRFVRAVGAAPQPATEEVRLVAARFHAPAISAPCAPCHKEQESPDDLGEHAAKYNAAAEYVPLALFLLSLPAEARAALADMRSEGMRAAAATIAAGLPVKKLPHPNFGAVFAYPRHVLEALYPSEAASESASDPVS